MPYVFKRKLVQIGGSIGVPIPPELLKELELEKGDEVKIDLKDDKCITVCK